MTDAGRSGASVDRIAAALLYEGYMLYPYRRSAVKNRQRFNFGVIYPDEHSRAQGGVDHSEMRTECLVLGGCQAPLDITVRFLHLFIGQPGSAGEPAWHDAIEREVTIRGVLVGDLLDDACSLPFGWPATNEPGRQDAIAGRVVAAADEVADGVQRVRVVISNLTPLGPSAAPDRDALMMRSLVSAHTILRTAGAKFVSLCDPPDALKDVARACRNVGTWPVLAGDGGAHDTVLSSPIIVSDFPEIAAESPGDFFDGTEMDEMLTLRILTLTDAEKREMASSDDRARRLLERTEALSDEQLMRMHGVLRQIRTLEHAP